MDFENDRPDLELVSNGEVVEKKDDDFVALELGEIKEEKVREETTVSDTPNVSNEQNVVESSVNTPVPEGGYAYYKCQSCGAQFVMSSYAPIGLCVFCGFGQIVKENEYDLSNRYLLPFVTSLNNAKKDYKKKIRFNPLVPGVFRKKKTIKKMKKLYIPCMIYDIDVSGPITFTAADSIKNVPSVPKQVYECGFTTNFNFENIVNCSCSQVSDEMFSSISQYSSSSMKELDSSFLGDASLVYPNEDSNQNLAVIKDRINKFCTSLARDSVNHELKKVKENGLNINIKTAKEVFVPIYLLNVKYKSRYYTFIKNGQNGKSVIDVAYEKKNLIVFGLVVFVISFIILLLLSFLF